MVIKGLCALRRVCFQKDVYYAGVKLFAEDLFHGFYFLFLTRVDDGYRRGLFGWAGGAAGAMGVALYVVRHCVVDDEREMVAGFLMVGLRCWWERLACRLSAL